MRSVSNGCVSERWTGGALSPVRSLFPLFASFEVADQRRDPVVACSVCPMQDREQILSRVRRLPVGMPRFRGVEEEVRRLREKLHDLRIAHSIRRIDS